MVRAIVLLILLALCSSAYATTPAITNVTGTVSSGQTLTITGTNMINDSSTNWINNASNLAGNKIDQAYFNSCSGAISSCAGWAYAGSGGTYATDNVLIGNRSVKIIDNTVCGSETSCGGERIYLSTNEITSGSYYASSYIYIDPDAYFPDQYMKFYLTVGSGGHMGEYYLDYGLDGDGTASGMTVKNAEVGDQTKHGTFEWDKGEWHYWEVHIDKTTSPGDTFTVWWDGVEAFSYTFSNHSDTYATFNELGIPNWAAQPGNYTTVPFTLWLARYAHSTTRIYPASTIQISGDGGSTWRWQPPTSLGETSIAVTADLPTLSSSNYLLRVTNNLQETSSTYAIGDSIAPVLTGGTLRGGTITH